MKRLLTLLISTILLFTQPACGLFGTETGNPVQSGTGDDAEDGEDLTSGPGPLSTSNLLYSLCNVVNSCIDSSEFNSSNCVDALNTDTEALAAFGANGYSSFDEIQDDIDNGNIEIDHTTYHDCVDAIEAKGCSVLGSSDVYEPGSADYSNLDIVISEECENIF